MSGKKLKFILRQLNPLIICIHQMLSLSSAMFITPLFHEPIQFTSQINRKFTSLTSGLC